MSDPLIALIEAAPGIAEWKDEKKTEATESPIFLFQSKSMVPSFDCANAHMLADQARYDQEIALGRDGDELPRTYCSSCEVVWRTERVFLTREEGENFGKAKHYNYTEGWRVYCVPCAGQLAKLLHALNKEAVMRF